MTTELRLLVATVILGLVQLIASSHLISFQYGYRWTGGSRDEAVPPLRRLANRMDQAATNFLETFPFFAALVLAAHFTNRDGLLTVWGAHLYFWARLGYLLCCGARIRPYSFGCFLEHGSGRYGTLPRCAFGMTVLKAEGKIMKDEVKAKLVPASGGSASSP
jgi:uncharacterized MAPEG superfamily protein